MKKVTVFILALLYITTSSGVTINMHYCMGKLVDLNFSHNKDQNCSNCGMKETESNGCCEDEKKFLKIDNAQKIADAAYQLPLFTSPALTNLFLEFSSVSVPSIMEEHPLNNSPSRQQGLPLFILNCVFRI